MTEKREYRMEELARLAGITTRTLRFYRERKLIPPPRREGRIAWYDDHHLARLRTISALLERGHTLNGIAELADALDHGRDVADLLGAAPTEEEPVRLTPEELAARFEGQVTPENLAAALELGYLGTDGGEIVHISRRLLDVSSALVREGIPLAEVWRRASRSASTSTTSRRCSPNWSCATPARTTSSACAHSPGAWWRRSFRWHWTDGCASRAIGTDGEDRTSGRRPPSPARGPTTARHASSRARRTP